MSWDTDEDSLQLNTMMSGGDSPPNFNTTATTDTIEAVIGGSGSGMTDTDVDSGARSRYNPRGSSNKRAPAIPAVRVNRELRDRTFREPIFCIYERALAVSLVVQQF